MMMMESLRVDTSATRSSYIPCFTSKNLSKWTEVEKRLNDPRFNVATARIFGEVKPINSCVRSALKKGLDLESSNSSRQLDCPPPNKKPRLESSSSDGDKATPKQCDSPCGCCSARYATEWGSLCKRILLIREKLQSVPELNKSYDQRVKELSERAKYTYEWLQNVPPPLTSQVLSPLHQEGCSYPSRNASFDAASSCPVAELSETYERHDSSFDSGTCVGDMQDQSVLKNLVAPSYVKNVENITIHGKKVMITLCESPQKMFSAPLSEGCEPPNKKIKLESSSGSVSNGTNDTYVDYAVLSPTEVASYSPMREKKSSYRNQSNSSFNTNSSVNDNSNEKQSTSSDYWEYLLANSKFESSPPEADNAYDKACENSNYSVVVSSQSDEESEVEWSKNTSSSCGVESEVEWYKNTSSSCGVESEVEWSKNTSSSCGNESEVERSKNTSSSSSNPEDENSSRWTDYKCYENIEVDENSQELPVSIKSNSSTSESTDSDYSESDASETCVERRDSTVSEISYAGSVVPYNNNLVMPNSMTYVVSSVPVLSLKNTNLEDCKAQFKSKNDDFRQIRCRAQRLRSALLSAQKAMCKEVKIVVPKLPDSIYQRHLKSKPIMLRNIFPLISQVKSVYDS